MILTDVVRRLVLSPVIYFLSCVNHIINKFSDLVKGPAAGARHAGHHDILSREGAEGGDTAASRILVTVGSRLNGECYGVEDIIIVDILGSILGDIAGGGTTADRFLIHVDVELGAQTHILAAEQLCQ